MAQEPGIGFPPSSETSLWRDVSRNLFEIAQVHGYAELSEPNALDNDISSMRKSVLFTEFIGSNQ